MTDLLIRVSCVTYFSLFNPYVVVVVVLSVFDPVYRCTYFIVKFPTVIGRPFQGYQSLKRAFHRILKTKCNDFLESTPEVYTHTPRILSFLQRKIQKSREKT